LVWLTNPCVFLFGFEQEKGFNAILTSHCTGSIRTQLAQYCTAKAALQWPSNSFSSLFHDILCMDFSKRNSNRQSVTLLLSTEARCFLLSSTHQPVKDESCQGQEDCSHPFAQATSPKPISIRMYYINNSI